MVSAKGNIKSRADWCAVNSPKKITEKIVLFAFLLFTANKSNSSMRFFGESSVRQSAFQNYRTFKYPSCSLLYFDWHWVLGSYRFHLCGLHSYTFSKNSPNIHICTYIILQNKRGWEIENIEGNENDIPSKVCLHDF